MDLHGNGIVESHLVCTSGLSMFVQYIGTVIPNFSTNLEQVECGILCHFKVVANSAVRDLVDWSCNLPSRTL